VGGSRGPGGRTGLGNRVWQIVTRDHRIEAEDDGVLDGILELTDVSRPLVGAQAGQGIG